MLFIKIQHLWDGNDILPGDTASSHSLAPPMSESLWFLFRGMFTLSKTPHTNISLCPSVIQHATWIKHYLLTHSFIMQWYIHYIHPTSGCTVQKLWFCVFILPGVKDAINMLSTGCCCVLSASVWLTLFFTNPAAAHAGWVHGFSWLQHFYKLCSMVAAGLW